MEKVILGLICFIVLYIAWESIKYSKQLRKKYERLNNELLTKSKDEKQKSSCCAKVSKAKAQSKHKHNSSKKQTKK